MKKLLPSLLLLTGLSCSTAFAQIPNGGFENWTTVGAYSDPNQWATLNSTTNLAGVYTCLQGTPGNPGSSYIKLVSKTVITTVVPGIATTGTINVSNNTVTGGFPFTQMPQSLTGNWQYMAYSGDQGYIGMVLTKWNTGTNSRDTVAFLSYPLPGMVMSWGTFNLPLTYYTTSIQPDTANILLSSSGANGATPVANSYLYVDNLAFAGSVGVQEHSSSLSGLNIFPNPAVNKINLEYTAKNAEKTKVQLFDITGKTVKEITFDSQKGQNKFSIETTGISSGIYFIRTGEMTQVKKIIIE